jgi:uncharacterized protein (DUF736 family)
MKRIEDRDYLSFKLDGTSSSAPIYANVFADEDGERCLSREAAERAG